MNPTAPTKNANATTSGSALSPTQYAANGAATHAATPAAITGRYPLSLTASKYSTAARPRATVTSATTPAGRHIDSARNTAASTRPLATATGRLRASATGAVAPALGGRWGAPPRRLGSGRRGMPDGSVPMVMRAGSRRAGSSGVATTAAVRPVVRAGATSSIVGSSSCHESSPVGSLGASGSPGDTSADAESDANDDHTSRSSVGLSGRSVTGILGISPVGGSVQCGSAPVSSVPKLIRSAANSSSIDVTGCSVVAPNSGPPNSSGSNESMSDSNDPGRPFDPSSDALRSSLMCGPFPRLRSTCDAHTSSSSCSLRPNAASICST